MIPVALTIAGSDPSGGAGIQADIKTFHRFGVYGEAVITLLTVQNTRSVARVHALDAALVLDQLEAVLADLPPAAAKTGALGSEQLVQRLAERAASFRFPLVVDPVMRSKQGALLVETDALERLRRELLPRAFLVTPNLAEAEWLTGRAVTNLAEMRDAARALCDLGAGAALVKGGHLPGPAIDVLCQAGLIQELRAERVETQHTHGTGCAYSAAIVAGLSQGKDLQTAVVNAKAFLTEAIRTNPGLGGGRGPLNFFA